MMKISKFNKQYWLMVTLFSVLSFSCSTTKKAKPCNECPSYTEVIPIRGTVTIPTVHYHEDYVCTWVMGQTFIIEDTIYIEIVL